MEHETSILLDANLTPKGKWIQLTGYRAINDVKISRVFLLSQRGKRNTRSYSLVDSNPGFSVLDDGPE